MDNLFEKFKTWFNRLDESAQLDAVMVDSLNSLHAWLSSLSLNQKLVLAAMVGVFMLATACVLWCCKRVYFSARRWCRRRRIPSDINLHLDREKNDFKHGANLRRNMQEMKEHAPYREKQ